MTKQTLFDLSFSNTIFIEYIQGSIEPVYEH